MKMKATLPDKQTPLQAFKTRPDKAFNDPAWFPFLITFPNHPRLRVFNCNNTKPGVSAPCQSYLRPRTATPR